MISVNKYIQIAKYLLHIYLAIVYISKALGHVKYRTNSSIITKIMDNVKSLMILDKLYYINSNI